MVLKRASHFVQCPVVVLVIYEDRSTREGFVPDVAPVFFFVKGVFFAVLVVLVDILQSFLQSLAVFTQMDVHDHASHSTVISTSSPLMDMRISLAMLAMMERSSSFLASCANSLSASIELTLEI